MPLPESIEHLLPEDADDLWRCALRRAIEGEILLARADGHDAGWASAVSDQIDGHENDASMWRAQADALKEKGGL